MSRFISIVVLVCGCNYADHAKDFVPPQADVSGPSGSGDADVSVASGTDGTSGGDTSGSGAPEVDTSGSGSEKIAENMVEYLECPDGWQAYLKGLACFNVFPDHLTRSQAENKCVQNQAQLAVIPDAATDDFVRELLSIQTRFWFGLVRAQKTHDFVWTDESKLDYFTNWKDGVDPVSGMGLLNCVMAAKSSDGYEWYQNECTLERPYLCQIDMLKEPCPNGWLNYDPGMTCFVIETDKKAFVDAESACVMQDAHLVKINDKGTNEFIRNMIVTANVPDKDSSFWIGLKRISTSYTVYWFEWDDTKQQPDYTNWLASADVADSTGDCVVYDRGNDIKYMWNNVDCGQSYPFVCQRDVSEVWSATCTHPWQMLRINDKRTRCYRPMENNPMSFNEAKVVCKEEGGSIVNTKTKSAATLVKGLLTSPNMYWIGLRRTSSQRVEYTWSDNDKDLGDFTDWSSTGAVHDDNRQCVMYSYEGDTYKWQTKNCDDAIPFICQKLPDLSSRVIDTDVTTTQDTPECTVTASTITTTAIDTTTVTASTITTTATDTTTVTASTITTTAIDTTTVKASTTIFVETTATVLPCLPTKVTTMPGKMQTKTTAASALIQPTTTTTIEIEPTTLTTGLDGQTLKEGTSLFTTCFCQYDLTYDPSPSGEALAEVTSQIQKELLVNVSKLSATRNRKTSAPDYRPSSQTIGYVSVVLFIIPIVLMIFSDLTYVVKSLSNIPEF